MWFFLVEEKHARPQLFDYPITRTISMFIVHNCANGVVSAIKTIERARSSRRSPVQIDSTARRRRHQTVAGAFLTHSFVHVQAWYPRNCVTHWQQFQGWHQFATWLHFWFQRSLDRFVRYREIKFNFQIAARVNCRCARKRMRIRLIKGRGKGVSVCEYMNNCIMSLHTKRINKGQ